MLFIIGRVIESLLETHLMKKMLLVLFIASLCSCGNSGTNNTTASDSSAAAPDTTLQPNGITNDAVISADTGAYKVQDADTAKNH